MQYLYCKTFKESSENKSSLAPVWKNYQMARKFTLRYFKPIILRNFTLRHFKPITFKYLIQKWLSSNTQTINIYDWSRTTFQYMN